MSTEVTEGEGLSLRCATGLTVALVDTVSPGYDVISCIIVRWSLWLCLFSAVCVMLVLRPCSCVGIPGIQYTGSYY